MNVSTVNEKDSQRLSAGAALRLRHWFVLGATSIEITLLLLREWVMAAGFALGAVVAFVGMLELEHAVGEFTARVAAASANEKSRDSGLRLATRFLLRYALMAAVCYAIFRVSRTAFYGSVAALFVPVAAMMLEAIYEAWLAMRGKL